MTTTTALIPLTTASDGATAVLGRDLHEFLEVKTHYKDWFPRMAEYGFVAGQDYVLKNELVLSTGRNRRYEQANHILTMDMAKHLAMVQRTDKGMQARNYFIEVEKQYRAQAAPALPTTYVDALKALVAAEEEKLALEDTNARQFAELEEAHPKVEAFDSFIDSTGLYSVGSAAKMLGIGRQKLFNTLRNQGILIAKGGMKNTPYQRYAHHFEVKGHEYERQDGTWGSSYTTWVRPSGVNFLSKKLGLDMQFVPAD